MLKFEEVLYGSALEELSVSINLCSGLRTRRISRRDSGSVLWDLVDAL